MRKTSAFLIWSSKHGVPWKALEGRTESPRGWRLLPEQMSWEADASWPTGVERADPRGPARGLSLDPVHSRPRERFLESSVPTPSRTPPQHSGSVCGAGRLLQEHRGSPAGKVEVRGDSVPQALWVSKAEEGSRTVLSRARGTPAPCHLPCPWPLLTLELFVGALLVSSSGQNPDPWELPLSDTRGQRLELHTRLL